MYRTFKLSFDVEIFGFFWLGGCFGYFLKKLSNVFPNHMAPLIYYWSKLGQIKQAG
jgi:hypothetical protein